MTLTPADEAKARELLRCICEEPEPNYSAGDFCPQCEYRDALALALAQARAEGADSATRDLTLRIASKLTETADAIRRLAATPPDQSTTKE